MGIQTEVTCTACGETTRRGLAANAFFPPRFCRCGADLDGQAMKRLLEQVHDLRRNPGGFPDYKQI